MATLIECDRCWATQRVDLPPGPNDCAPIGIVATPMRVAGLPHGWIRLTAIALSVPNPLERGGTIEGGEFCGSCAAKLAEWRRPIPLAKPA